MGSSVRECRNCQFPSEFTPLRRADCMFNQSYQQIQFDKQIIALCTNYPCPRCSGMLEPFGLTETFQCNSCDRNYVPLHGGRLLHPANRMGLKIAPTFWWDGLRWHWAGTTATAKQLVSIVGAFFVPLLALNGALSLNLWTDRPDWCSPVLLTAIFGLLTIQLIYLMCWDFDFLTKKKT